MVEQVIYRAIGAKIATKLGKRMTNLGHRAISVVRQAIHHDGSAARPIAFVANFLVIRTVGLASAAFYRPFDIIFGHALRFGFIDCQTEPGIRIKIAAAHLGGDRDLAYQLRKEFAALFILRTLAMLDIRPFTVSCHVVLLLHCPSKTPTRQAGRNCAYDNGY